MPFNTKPSQEKWIPFDRLQYFNWELKSKETQRNNDHNFFDNAYCLIKKKFNSFGTAFASLHSMDFVREYSTW